MHPRRLVTPTPTIPHLQLPPPLPFPKPKAGPASWGHAEGTPPPRHQPLCSEDGPRGSLAPHSVCRPLGPSAGGLPPSSGGQG